MEERHGSLLYPILNHLDIYRYITDAIPTDIASLAAEYKTIESRRHPTKNKLWLDWAVKRKKDAQYLGRVEADVWPHDKVARIAYLLHPDYWRNGYASEACVKMIDIIKTDFSLKVCEATCSVDNIASISLLEKLGFTRKETLQNNECIDGQWIDEYLYEKAI